MPLQTTINQCFTTIDTLNAAQDTEEKRGAENSTLQESVYKKQKKIIESSRLYKNNYKSINTMIMLIVDLATKSNISMSSHQPHTPVEHSWYITHSFKTEFQGPFASLVNFLEALKSQPTINLSMVHLSKSDGIVSLVCDFNLIEIKKDCHEIPSIS
jgi:hypothetical protein